MIPERTAFGEPLMTAAEVAAVLGMSRRWVYAQVEQNELPAYKLGRSLAFELSAVRQWLERNQIGEWASNCDECIEDDSIPDRGDDG